MKPKPYEIRAFLDKHGLIPVKLDRAFHQSPGTCSMWLSGKRNPGRWLRPAMHLLNFCISRNPDKYWPR